MNELKLKKTLITTLLASASLFQAESVLAFPYDVGTGTQTVKCKKVKGQKCDLGRAIRLYSPHQSHHYLHFKNPTKSCSPFRYKISNSNDKIIAVTKSLNPGMAQNIRLAMKPLRVSDGRRRYYLKIQAEGQIGGCNFGRIFSWAYEARLYQSNPPSTPFIPLKYNSNLIPKNKIFTPPNKLSISPLKKTPPVPRLDLKVK